MPYNPNLDSEYFNPYERISDGLSGDCYGFPFATQSHSGHWTLELFTHMNTFHMSCQVILSSCPIVTIWTMAHINIFLMYCKVIISSYLIITMRAVNNLVHMNEYLMSCQVTIMSSLTTTILALRHLINVSTICK